MSQALYQMQQDQQRLEEVGDKFARLAERFSRMALNPRVFDETERLIDHIEFLARELER